MNRAFLGFGICFAVAIAANPLQSVASGALGLSTSPVPGNSGGDALRPVDTSINTFLQGNGLQTGLTTAVVPIVGFSGSDATLRFAQVSGPQAAVAHVRAVLEIDNDAGRGPYQFTSLIPVASVLDHGRGHRVDGVGVTAIIAK